MKTFILIPLLLCMAFPSLAEAEKERSFVQMKCKFENVKVYQQASTSTDVLVKLDQDQEIDVLRKSVVNGGIWTIVSLDGKPGYVLTSELYQEPVQSAKAKARKQKKSEKKEARMSYYELPKN